MFSFVVDRRRVKSRHLVWSCIRFVRYPAKNIHFLTTYYSANVEDCKISDIEIGPEIGRGEYGVVHSGTILATGERGALKLLKSEQEDSIAAFKKEADQLRALTHRNVVRLVKAQLSASPYMLVFEYMAVGDMKTYLAAVRESGIKITISHQVHIIKDIAAGFAYLQSQKYIHRDLAARNVLLDSGYTAKISDFGMARQLFAHEYYQQGSALSSTSSSWTLPLRWMAPESYTDGTWDLRTDVWMFGVLLWEVFSMCELPWRGLADSQVIVNIQRRAKLEQPTDSPNEFYYDIMLSCWRLDPHSRITSSDIEKVVAQYVTENMKEIDFERLSWPDAADVKSTVQVEHIGVDLHNESAADTVKSLEISRDDIIVGELLGEGAFGAVHKGKIITQKGAGQMDVALKTIKGDCIIQIL